MSSVVYTQIPSCDPALAGEAAAIGVADLHEALGPVAGRAALMEPALRALVPGVRIAGQAVTALNYPGDNLMMHCALRLAARGQVLVTTNGGAAHGAQWGKMATVNAQAKGLAGVIVDGCVRDVDALREMTYPVWASAVSAAHAEKRGPGLVNAPIVCGGVCVSPGDMIVADGDGVLAVPLALLPKALERARAYAVRERAWTEQMRAGANLYDLAGIAAAAAAGVETRDTTWAPDN